MAVLSIPSQNNLGLSNSYLDIQDDLAGEYAVVEFARMYLRLSDPSSRTKGNIKGN